MRHLTKMEIIKRDMQKEGWYITFDEVDTNKPTEQPISIRNSNTGTYHQKIVLINSNYTKNCTRVINQLWNKVANQ